MFSETVFINPKIRKIVSAIVVYSSLAAAILFLGFLLIFFENPQWDRFQPARVILLEYQRDRRFRLTERSIAGNFSRKMLERLLGWKLFTVRKYEYDLHWRDYWERSAASESVVTRWAGGVGRVRAVGLASWWNSQRLWFGDSLLRTRFLQMMPDWDWTSDVPSSCHCFARHAHQSCDHYAASSHPTERPSLEKPCDHYLLCISEGTGASCPSKANRRESLCIYRQKSCAHRSAAGVRGFWRDEPTIFSIKLRISVAAIGQRWWGKVKIE